MPIDLPVLCRRIEPEDTVLLFGAGSSIPSGGMSGGQLAEAIAGRFSVAFDASLTLSEVATIVEKTVDRKSLIHYLRSLIKNLRPTGGLLNLPLFNWKSIYTTNYDTLIERTYEKKGKKCEVYRSNFDFKLSEPIGRTQLYKLHGSIDQDVSDGHNARIVISVNDYDLTDQYRELLYDSFKLQISSGHLLIIGYSLSDPDLRSAIDEALRRKRDSGAQGRIYLLLYAEDHNRALIYEDRGIDVCFGSLDDFFAELSKDIPQSQLVLEVTNEPLDRAPIVRPSTIDVSHATTNIQPDLLKMFNGRSATYADIIHGWTFERECAGRLESQLAGDNARVAYILGAAGVGKSTTARQTLIKLSQRGITCWEHNSDITLPASGWVEIDNELRKRTETAVLFIDDAHDHIREINTLIDAISTRPTAALKLVLVSTFPHWNPRLKSPGIFTHGQQYSMGTLSENEINLMLDLLDAQPAIRSLIEEGFLGFARPERRRRLIDRCSADMFVCLKNIFGFQSINNIILQEYAGLPENYQEIYRTISAMETAGVRVHRQLVIRSININVNHLAQILEDLEGTISEYTISDKHGLYGWRVRHSVIASIVADHKFSNQDELYTLFDNIIGNLNPSYQIELRTIRNICDIREGIGKIKNKKKQNYLFRRLISLAPGERVPRHRLIWNLIDQGEIEQAENEIRVFEKELRPDGPVYRYKTKLQLKMASDTPGIMTSDRVAIVNKAALQAEAGIRDFPDDKNMYRSYCEVGIVHLRLTGNWQTYDSAMAKAREAETRILDPDLRRMISTYEGLGQRIQRGQDAI